MKRNYIRSILFDISFLSLTAVFCTILLPVFFMRRKTFLKIVDLWVYSVLLLERAILKLDFEVRGEENLPADGRYIIAAKHQSTYETFKLPILFKDPAIILKRELLRIPLWGQYLKKLDVIAINRSDKKSAVQSIREGSKRMANQGRPIIIFPQGTRTRPEDTPDKKPYKTGVHRIQEETGLPIIPLALNSGLYWPRHGLFKSSGTVVFEFLEPVYPGRTYKELTAHLQTSIEEKSNQLAAEAIAANNRAHRDSLPAFRAATIITAILAALVFAFYSLSWFVVADKMKKHFSSFTTESIQTSGFPFAITMDAKNMHTVLDQNIKISTQNVTVKAWPIPQSTMTVKAEGIGVHVSQWPNPLRFDRFDARFNVKDTLIMINSAALSRAAMSLAVSGEIETAQKPVPRPDLNVKITAPHVLAGALTDAGAIDKKTALFVAAGLSALTKDKGLAEVQIFQKNRKIYAGPLQIFDLDTAGQ